MTRATRHEAAAVAKSRNTICQVLPRSRERRERSSTMTASKSFFFASASRRRRPGLAVCAPDIAASWWTATT